MVVHLETPVASAKPAYANFHGLQEEALDQYEYFSGTIYTLPRVHGEGYRYHGGRAFHARPGRRSRINAVAINTILKSTTWENFLTL
jgi:hypothetical protein